MDRLSYINEQNKIQMSLTEYAADILNWDKNSFADSKTKSEFVNRVIQNYHDESRVTLLSEQNNEKERLESILYKQFTKGTAEGKIVDKAIGLLVDAQRQTLISEIGTIKKSKKSVSFQIRLQNKTLSLF